MHHGEWHIHIVLILICVTVNFYIIKLIMNSYDYNNVRKETKSFIFIEVYENNYKM